MDSPRRSLLELKHRNNFDSNLTEQRASNILIQNRVVFELITKNKVREALELIEQTPILISIKGGTNLFYFTCSTPDYEKVFIQLCQFALNISEENRGPFNDALNQLDEQNQNTCLHVICKAGNSKLIPIILQFHELELLTRDKNGQIAFDLLPLTFKREKTNFSSQDIYAANFYRSSSPIIRRCQNAIQEAGQLILSNLHEKDEAILKKIQEIKKITELNQQDSIEKLDELVELEQKQKELKKGQSALKNALIQRLGYHLVIQVKQLKSTESNSQAQIETTTRFIEVSIDIDRNGPSPKSLYPIPPSVRTETSFQFRFFDNSFEEILTDENYQNQLIKGAAKLKLEPKSKSKKDLDNENRNLSELANHFFEKYGESRYAMLLFINEKLPSKLQPYFSHLIQNYNFELSIIPTPNVTQALDQYNFAKLSKTEEQEEESQEKTETNEILNSIEIILPKSKSKEEKEKTQIISTDSSTSIHVSTANDSPIQFGGSLTFKH